MANKLDKTLHEKHAKRLSAILNPQSTFAAYLGRPEFNTILKLELNTLAEIEKKLPDDKLDKDLTSAILLKKFNELTKQEFKLGVKFKFDDEGDLIDNVNYLVTYCKNIFKVNIDDVVGGKKVTASNPNIDLRSKPEPGEDPMMDAASAFNMGAMGYAGSAYENPYLMGKAYAKLNKDIAEGKIYQYKSKPRIIPICKWILVILLGLGIVSLLVTAIFCFMTNGLHFTVDSSESPDRYLGTITSGIFYLICIGFAIYIFIITLKTLVKKNGKTNDNLLYQFTWFFYLAYIILVALISILDIVNVWVSAASIKIVEDAASVHNVGFQGWKISLIVVAGLTGLCIIPMILGAVNAPKQDKDRIEDLLKQYINEVVPPSQQGPEVQKPVDVKTSEKKNTDNKSDDTKHLKS